MRWERCERRESRAMRVRRRDVVKGGATGKGSCVRHHDVRVAFSFFQLSLLNIFDYSHYLLIGRGVIASPPPLGRASSAPAAFG